MFVKRFRSTGGKVRPQTTLAWLARLDRTHERQGYMVAKDLAPLPLWLARFVLWAGHRLGNWHRCSTVVDGTTAICFSDRSTLVGYYPSAHVETRYTTDLKLFKKRIWSDA